MKINWNEIWKDFNDWFEKNNCSVWSEQQEKIRQLVNEQLRRQK